MLLRDSQYKGDATYDAVAAAPGAYAGFRRGVDLLLEREIPFFVKSVLLPPNKHELDEFEAWAETLPGMDRKPPYAIFLDHRTRRDSPAKNRRIDKLRFSPADGLALLARDEAAFRRSQAQFAAQFLRPQGDRLFDCDAGTAGCVDAYGKLQMCMMLRHPDTVYDLRGGTIKAALTEDFPELRDLRASNPDYLARCARCFIKGLCEQCPAKSWSEHGTLDTPVEYHCQVAHVQARFLGLVGEDENAWEVRDWQARLDRFAAQQAIE